MLENFFLFYFNYEKLHILSLLNCHVCENKGRHRAQRDSVRSQTIHFKGTAYYITKYQIFLTKYGLACNFKKKFVNIKDTAYQIL